MPLAMAEKKEKSATCDGIEILTEAMAIQRTTDLELLLKAGKKLIQKIVPNRGLALLKYDSEQKKHSILAVFPQSFKKTVELHLEEGIIGLVQSQYQTTVPWHGLDQQKNGLTGMIFIPVHRQHHPLGLVQILPKDGNQDLDEFLKVRLHFVADLILNQIEFIQLYQMVKDSNKTLANITSQFQKTNKMVALGELAGSVAHEINNPMTTVLGRLQLLLASEELPEQIRSKMEVITFQAKRISNLIHALLSFARGNDKDFISNNIAINDEIKNALSLTSHSLEIKQIEIEMDLDKNLPKISGDPTQLQQVFINLINNAGRAIGNKGKLTIRSFGRKEDILISISDSGCGISSEEIHRIFDPLYSTKKQSGGTGLGLSICRQIVDKHGGTISVESEVGAGTEFKIALPIPSTG